MRALHSKLPRLAPAAYTGMVCVHWTMTLENRAKGWLSPILHLAMREVLLHACVRAHSVVPVYCFMPDHAHFMVLGAHPEADSRRWARELRMGWSRILPAGFQLQRQAYDHVLREEERERAALEAIAWYILENPVRAELCQAAETWEYSGTIFPGLALLDFRKLNFWETFWKVYNRALEVKESGQNLPISATGEP